MKRFGISMCLLFLATVLVSPPALAKASGPGPTGARLVTPTPGMVNAHPISWERAQRRSERVVRVFFWSGVEPCSVLDHVDVEYLRREVRITLFEGTDPRAVNVACIQVAEHKAVDVRLSQPLRGRTIVDGSNAGIPVTHTVTGTAIGAPVCPVESFPPDPQCSPRPVAGASLEVRRRSGQLIASTVTDDGGGFSFDLAPGDYTLVPQPVGGLMGTAPRVNFTVRGSGPPVELTVIYDTGIR